MKFTESCDRASVRTHGFFEFNAPAPGNAQAARGFGERLEGLQEKSRRILYDDFSGLQSSNLLMGVPYEKLK